MQTNKKTPPLLQDKITEIFIKVDDFCNEFKNEFSNYETQTLGSGKTIRNRASSLCDSEIITILISFHGGTFRNFKHFYTNYCCVHLKMSSLIWFPIIASLN